MPLPLGHTALGLLTHECSSKKMISLSSLRIMFFIIVLANLPDLDVIFGLILEGNGNAFHRGPTHSLVFAALMGLVASGLGRFSNLFPKISFSTCFAIIFSHTLADLFFTDSPVSLLWPFEIQWAAGFSSLNEVVSSVLFEGYRDVGLIIICITMIILIRAIKYLKSDENVYNNVRNLKLERVLLPLKTSRVRKPKI